MQERENDTMVIMEKAAINLLRIREENRELRQRIGLQGDFPEADTHADKEGQEYHPPGPVPVVLEAKGGVARGQQEIASIERDSMVLLCHFFSML